MLLLSYALFSLLLVQSSLHSSDVPEGMKDFIEQPHQAQNTTTVKPVSLTAPKTFTLPLRGQHPFFDHYCSPAMYAKQPVRSFIILQPTKAALNYLADKKDDSSLKEGQIPFEAHHVIVFPQLTPKNLERLAQDHECKKEFDEHAKGCAESTSFAYKGTIIASTLFATICKNPHLLDHAKNIIPPPFNKLICIQTASATIGVCAAVEWYLNYTHDKDKEAELNSKMKQIWNATRHSGVANAKFTPPFPGMDPKTIEKHISNNQKFELKNKLFEKQRTMVAQYIHDTIVKEHPKDTMPFLLTTPKDAPWYSYSFPMQLTQVSTKTPLSDDATCFIQQMCGFIKPSATKPSADDRDNPLILIRKLNHEFNTTQPDTAMLLTDLGAKRVVVEDAQHTQGEATNTPSSYYIIDGMTQHEFLKIMAHALPRKTTRGEDASCAQTWEEAVQKYASITKNGTPGLVITDDAVPGLAAKFTTQLRSPIVSKGGQKPVKFPGWSFVSPLDVSDTNAQSASVYQNPVYRKITTSQQLAWETPEGALQPISPLLPAMLLQDEVKKMAPPQQGISPQQLQQLMTQGG